MVVAEGLTPYLAADEGRRLISRLVSHLASGELMFDAYSHFGLKLLRLKPAVRATGAEVHWAIEDPHELERAVPKLRFVEDISAYKPEHGRWGSHVKLMDASAEILPTNLALYLTAAVARRDGGAVGRLSVASDGDDVRAFGDRQRPIARIHSTSRRR